MKAIPVCALVLSATLAAAGEEQGPVRPFESEADLTPEQRIDELVLDRLKELGIRPAKVCSDAVFVRRVYLDAIGTLPTVEEAGEFILSEDSAKRGALIDRLLERSEFADYWAMKWCDTLRVKGEFPINLWPNGVQAYHRWIRTAIRDGMPYDRFARRLLTASGSNFRVPEVNFYRAIESTEPRAIAAAVALTFMGARAKRWSEERLDGIAAFFSYVGYKRSAEWKEEIVFYDSVRADEDAAAGRSMAAVFPDGVAVRLSPDRDPREVFADWLIDPGNPWFARNIVNRIWYWLVGRGVIHEPDDIHRLNPAGNLRLLAFLEDELSLAVYDLKHIYRLILNSKTYQLSSIPRSTDPRAAACFASYPLRQLDAEVLADAISGITGTTETYSSSTPEPFTFIPEHQRSIQLADGSITSPFLEMFGRPPRDTGLLSERSLQPTAAQRLHLLNSSHIQSKLEESPELRSRTRSGDPDAAVTRLYLTVLSRFPTDGELRAARDYARSGVVSPRDVSVDLAWALINSAEFLYRH